MLLIFSYTNPHFLLIFLSDIRLFLIAYNLLCKEIPITQKSPRQDIPVRDDKSRGATLIHKYIQLHIIIYYITYAVHIIYTSNALQAFKWNRIIHITIICIYSIYGNHIQCYNYNITISCYTYNVIKIYLSHYRILLYPPSITWGHVTDY